MRGLAVVPVQLVLGCVTIAIPSAPVWFFLGLG